MAGYDKEDKAWFEAMKAKGHMPILDAGKLDVWVIDYDIHNGPGCAVCGWSCCMHCERPETIPECDVIAGDLVPPLLEGTKP